MTWRFLRVSDPDNGVRPGGLDEHSGQASLWSSTILHVSSSCGCLSWRRLVVTERASSTSRANPSARLQTLCHGRCLCLGPSGRLCRAARCRPSTCLLELGLVPAPVRPFVRVLLVWVLIALESRGVGHERVKVIKTSGSIPTNFGLSTQPALRSGVRRLSIQSHWRAMRSDSNPDPPSLPEKICRRTPTD